MLRWFFQTEGCTAKFSPHPGEVKDRTSATEERGEELATVMKSEHRATEETHVQWEPGEDRWLSGDRRGGRTCSGLTSSHLPFIKLRGHTRHSPRPPVGQKQGLCSSWHSGPGTSLSGRWALPCALLGAWRLLWPLLP